MQIPQRLKTQRKWCKKWAIFFRNWNRISAIQRVPRARLAPQALPVHLDRGDKKEPGDEEGRKENPEIKEIKVLWDRWERAVSKASWDLLGLREKWDLKETWDPQVCRELKENLVNRFQLLLLLFLLQRWLSMKAGQPRFSVQPAVILSLL